MKLHLYSLLLVVGIGTLVQAVASQGGEKKQPWGDALAPESKKKWDDAILEADALQNEMQALVPDKELPDFLERLDKLRVSMRSLPYPESLNQEYNGKPAQLRQLLLEKVDVIEVAVYEKKVTNDPSYVPKIVKMLIALDSDKTTPKTRDDVRRLLSSPRYSVEYANQLAAAEQDRITSQVADPEPLKHGGPDTATVVKIVLGQGERSSSIEAEG